MKVVVSRLLVLLASAQAFQLQNNNNDHHHLVSLTHQQQPTQPLDNTLLHLPLDNKPTINNKKKLLLSNFYSPQTAATQINRTVNRNTKNRQNQSKCSFDAPHSTLLDITTTPSHHHHHHSNDGNDKNNNKNIQRSLRQLGITIASTFLIVTQARVSVANAAAAYTPLLVTHPSGVGSTAITPLLSTLPYHGMAIVPSLSWFNKMKGGGLSPAVGEIVMSFAYVIIALGVSHSLMRVAEGGHVKMLKLLAWQNLADDDGSGSTTVASSSSKSTTKSNKKEGRGIQGLVSRYTYMVQLIFNEIRKAHRVGQTLVPATTAPMATTSPPNMILSRYAFLLNRSFQETYNKDKDHPDNDDESTILTSWKEYSNLLQQKMTNKKKGKKQTSRTSSRSRVFGKGGLVYNKFAMMFERVAKSDSEAEATKKATDLFQQKKYEQHHHHVHVPRSAIEESSYLDSLTRFAVGEEDLLQHHEHKQVEGYLDTLSKEEARKSTWEVYKDQVERAKKEKENHDEVDYLKEELVHVQSLLQDEQSMYQTSNQALNLVVEAQNEELKHARAATTNTQGQQHSTMDELKEFDIKAKEYDEAIKESKEVEKSDNASTPPHEWIY